jgi:putative ABC transport system permease protein
MRYLPLVWRNLLRRKMRTSFTLLSILVAFVLFCFLMAIKMAFTLGVELAGADRMIVTHKTSIIMPLPERYLARIEATKGVTDVAWASWFGGVYKEPANFFAQLAVDPERWLRMYPEFVLPPDQKKRWLEDRTSAIVGRATADRFGWKVGDRIPIQATIFHPKNGGLTWEFNLVGIYEGAVKGTDTTQFFFRHDFLEENRRGWHGMVGWYIFRLKDPALAPSVARELDSAFANSSAETKTQPEKAFMAAFANQIGDIGTIMMAILAAVFFTILLVAGNTMAQAVRERTSELAVLKTLGFTDGRVLALVLVESCLLAALGGFLGLAIGWTLVQQGDPTKGMLPAFYLPGRDVALGAAFVLLLGAATGLLPALQARRLKIVDALRKV